MEPSHYYARPFLGLVYALQGDLDKAVAELEEGMRLGKNPQGMAQLAYAYAKRGRRSDAEAALRDIEADAKGVFSSPDVAAVYVALGDTEQAFVFLDRAAEAKAEFLVFLGVDPRFDPVRSDPRYKELLEKLGLPG